MEIKVIILSFIIIATILITAYLKDDKIKNEKKLNKKTGIKSLGNMPFNENNKNFLIENNPKANIMKYIKDIRTNILNSANKQTIAVISYKSGEGKSWVANNTAMSLARLNKKVLLIDANLREISNKSQIFYAEETEGLSNYIKDIEIEDKIGNLQKSKKYIKRTQIPYMHIMQSGTISISSYELIKSQKVQVLFNLLKEMYDYIIIDGTSFLNNNDCLNLSTIVDTSIIVVEANKTKYNEILTMKEEIEDNNGEILGFILNKTNVKHGKYYGKNIKNKYGMYIETTAENKEKSELTLDEIITSIEEKMPKREEKQEFETLHQEIKDKILIEDFINDIETNFNLKIENIEKQTIQMQQNFLQAFQKLQNEVTETKEQNTYENQYFYNKIIKEIKNNNKDQILSEIIQKIENLNYDKQMEQINEKIDNINYDEEIQEIKQSLENANYQGQIEEIKEQIKYKKEEENKKSNNIINLGRLFMENRKKTTNVFSIDEPIYFEDLERLAIEVIELDETEDNSQYELIK